MKRTTGPDHVIDLFGPGKHGFTDGVPGVSAATLIGDDIFNSWQEELARAIELSGLTLNPADNTQLYQAILANGGLGAAAVEEATNYAIQRGAVANHAAGTVPSNFITRTLCGHNNGSADVVIAAGETSGNTAISIGVTSSWTWAAVPPAVFPAAGAFYGSASNGPLVALVGGASSTSYAQTSPSGATWTSRLSVASVGPLNAVCVHGAGFVAVGMGAQVYRSTSGVSWTPGTALAGAHLYGVASNGTRIVAVGVNSAGTTPVVQTSDDSGVTWVARTPAGTGFVTFRSVVWTGKAWIAVGISGEVQVSTDGATWHREFLDGSSPNHMYSVTLIGDSAVLAVGDAAEIQTARLDGTRWTRVSKMGAEGTVLSPTVGLYAATRSAPLRRVFFSGTVLRFTDSW